MFSLLTGSFILGPKDLQLLFDFFIDITKAFKQGRNPCLKDELVSKLEYTDMKASTEKPRKVLILGSGGLSIGQAGEFDYSGSQVGNSYLLLKSEMTLHIRMVWLFVPKCCIYGCVLVVEVQQWSEGCGFKPWPRL